MHYSPIRRRRRTIKLLKYVVLILAVITSGLLYTNVYAAQKEYSITNYDINVDILEDGTADVEEIITYDFNGDYNGVFLDIDFSGSKGFKINSLFIKKSSGTKEAVQDDSGEAGTYSFHIDGEVAKFKVFEPTSDQTATFIYRYTLADVVTIYNDAAEFNRKMVGRNWQIPVHNVKISIKLPEGASRDEIKVFAHGPLTGESRIVDGRVSEFVVPDVNPGVFFETRLLFPVRLVPASKNTVSMNVLAAILEQEAIWAQEANEQRKKAKDDLKRANALRVVGQVLTLLLLIVWVHRIIRIKKEYGTDPKTDFDGKYYRDIPGDYPPAELNSLFHCSTPTSSDILATLLNLVRRRVLLLDTRKTIQKSFLKKNEKTEYIFTLNSQVKPVNLKSHEEFLMDWFFNIIGEGQRFSLSDIRMYVKKKESALSFTKKFDQWKQLVNKDSSKNKFYPDKPKPGRGYGLLWGMGFVAAGLAAGASTGYNMAAAIAALGLFMFFFSFFQYRRTEYGSDQYKKWKAFKNFIKDFSRIEDATIPSVAVWEHYLVYAIPLGVAKEVIKQFPLEIEHESGTLAAESAIAYSIIGSNQDLNDSFSFNDAFDQMNSVVSDTFKIAYSSTSSGSGSGGGASSGDSGGGGGGSGGGAF